MIEHSVADPARTPEIVTVPNTTAPPSHLQQQQHSGTRHNILQLPEEVLLDLASYLPDPSDLVNYQRTCTHLSHLSTDRLWKEICRRRWNGLPRYELSPRRETELKRRYHPEATQQKHIGWKELYRRVEDDLGRSDITTYDVNELGWTFNYTPEAGGTGRSPTRCVFSGGWMYLPGYPPLPWEIVAEETVVHHNVGIDGGGTTTAGRQWVKIGLFPKHYVTRLSEEYGREWMVWNENVTILSCHPDDCTIVLNDERGFNLANDDGSED